MWKSADRAPSWKFYPGICLTTEEKARKNLQSTEKCGKKIYRKTGKAIDDNMAHEHCMLDTQGYKHTLMIRNIWCFSAATMAAKTPLLGVMLHAQCLLCQLIQGEKLHPKARVRQSRIRVSTLCIFDGFCWRILGLGLTSIPAHMPSVQRFRGSTADFLRIPMSVAPTEAGGKTREPLKPSRLADSWTKESAEWKVTP
jgi:hypothetical protein